MQLKICVELRAPSTLKLPFLFQVCRKLCRFLQLVRDKKGGRETENLMESNKKKMSKHANKKYYHPPPQNLLAYAVLNYPIMQLTTFF